MGHQWAEDDEKPLEQFVHKLHGMFLAVLRARKEKEDQEGEGGPGGPLIPGGAPQGTAGPLPMAPAATPRTQGVPDVHSPIGPLPRDWKWVAGFLPALLRWLTELMWLPADEAPPQGHNWVSFMGLALDLSPMPYSHRHPRRISKACFKGTELSLQEKGRVLRPAVTLLGRTLGKESILPAPMTTTCRSLVPLGAGTVVGVKGRPPFTRPMVVWHHLRWMQQYGAERWALQKQARASQRKQKTPQGRPNRQDAQHQRRDSANAPRG